MAAVLLACLSAFFLGTLNVASRVALRRSTDLLGGAVTLTALTLVVTVVAALASGVGTDDLALDQIWPFLVIGAIVPGVTQMLYLRAVRAAGPARTGILLGSSPLLSAVLAIVVLGEPARLPLLLGAALVVAGGVALAWEKERPASFRWIGVAFAATVATAAAGRDVAARWALEETHAAPLAQTSALLASATAVQLAFLLANRRDGPALTRLAAAARPFLLPGLLLGGSYICLIEAFARGPVSVVSPLNGTSALWSVATAAVFFRADLVRARLAAAAVLVVAGAALIGATRTTPETAAAADAVARFREQAPASPPAGAGPPPGVYRYATTGGERIDFLLGEEHAYPAETTVTVLTAACGHSERWDALDERWDGRVLCRTAGGLTLPEYRETHRFAGTTHRRHYVCDPGALTEPADLAAGATWTFGCTSDDTTERWRGTLVGRETLVVDGAPVETTHVAFTTVVDGHTAGTAEKEYWRRADGLLVRARIADRSVTDELVDVGYDERYEIALASLDPER